MTVGLFCNLSVDAGVLQVAKRHWRVRRRRIVRRSEEVLQPSAHGKLLAQVPRRLDYTRAAQVPKGLARSAAPEAVSFPESALGSALSHEVSVHGASPSRGRQAE